MAGKVARGGLAAVSLATLLGCAGPGAFSSTAPHSFVVTSPSRATLGGEIHRPSGPGPFPAVIVMHGCGGRGVNMQDWGQWLSSEGYAAFVVDSFGGRGLKRVCGDPTIFPPRDRAPDAFAAAAYLKSLPFVDGERIAVMGFSHGGGTVLWAMATESQHPETRLRGFIAFYPGCASLAGYRGTSPLLMLLGAKDDWAPPEGCQRLAERLKLAGKPVTSITYRNARHAFDSPHIRGVVHVSDARRGQGATIAYDPQAHEDSLRQVRKFLAEHLAR